jgi:hypothetical protein
MKNKRLLFLVGITAISAIIATSILLNTPERFSPNNEQIGAYLVKPFGENAVAEIRVKDADNEVILKRADNGWVVANRQDYPIDNPGEVLQLLRSLQQFKIGLEVPAGPEHYAQIGLLNPESTEEAETYQEERKEEGEANPADPRGTQVYVKGADGSTLVDLVLGEQFGQIASRSPRGLVVRSKADYPGIWKALGTLNLATGDAESKNTDKRRGPIPSPTSWLSYKFIEVAKLKSITLSAPNDEGFKGWTASREDENGDFSTGGLADDEEMDTAATGSFKSLFSSLRFEDVLEESAFEEGKTSKSARKAVLTTFDGFTYTIDFAPQSAEEKADGEDAPPSPSPNYAGTVKVEANLLTERPKNDEETKEEAENAEKLFQATLDNLKYKLELEKVFASRVYEFANFAISSLNKARNEIIKKKEAETGDAGSAGLLPSAPGTTAVSPPIAIPPRPSVTPAPPVNTPPPAGDQPKE